MKAMILAEGEGRRMRPLTEHKPKPLLEVAAKSLIARHIEALADAGFHDIVVNAAYLGEQLADVCGDGSRWGVRIQMSMESAPLETAGGIIHALPLLGDAPFVVVNGDVFTDFPLQRLRQVVPTDKGAHIILVPNPDHHPDGDFALLGSRVLPKHELPQQALTYSGIGVFHPEFFAQIDGLNSEISAAGAVKLALRPLLDRTIAFGTLTAEQWSGRWFDIGTPQRLAQLDALLSREAPREPVN